VSAPPHFSGKVGSLLSERVTPWTPNAETTTVTNSWASACGRG
jgi:hypothetical protein